MAQPSNGSIFLKAEWIFRLAAVAALMLAIIAFILNCWPAAFMRSFPNALNSPLRQLLLPKAAGALAWEKYAERRWADAASLAADFNSWQPTADTILFEGRCRQEMGQTDQARVLYRQASRFDPRSRAARLALIDLDLRMSEGRPPSLSAVDDLLALIPWDDAKGVETIAARLAGMAESVSGSQRLQFAARVLYLGPSHQTLRKAGLLLLQDTSLTEEARRIGAWVIAASLLEERGRVSEGDSLRLDQLLPNWARAGTKNALAKGEFRRTSPAEMSQLVPSPAFLFPVRDGVLFDVCLDRVWLGWLGAWLRDLDEHR